MGDYRQLASQALAVNRKPIRGIQYCMPSGQGRWAAQETCATNAVSELALLAPSNYVANKSERRGHEKL